MINNHCNKPIWSTLVELNIAKRTKRGCRGGRNKIRSIKPLITERKQTLKTSFHSNSANLIRCPISHQSYPAQINCRFAVWNAARMNKKNCTTSIIDFIVSNKLDILAITETWLKGGKQDDCVLADIQNALPDFDVHHVPTKVEMEEAFASFCEKVLRYSEMKSACLNPLSIWMLQSHPVVNRLECS